MNTDIRKSIRRVVLVAIIIFMGILLNCLYSYQAKQRIIFTTEKWINGGYKDRHYIIAVTAEIVPGWQL